MDKNLKKFQEYLKNIEKVIKEYFLTINQNLDDAREFFLNIQNFADNSVFTIVDSWGNKRASFIVSLNSSYSIEQYAIQYSSIDILSNKDIELVSSIFKKIIFHDIENVDINSVTFYGREFTLHPIPGSPGETQQAFFYRDKDLDKLFNDNILNKDSFNWRLNGEKFRKLPGTGKTVLKDIEDSLIASKEDVLAIEDFLKNPPNINKKDGEVIISDLVSRLRDNFKNAHINYKIVQKQDSIFGRLANIEIIFSNKEKIIFEAEFEDEILLIHDSLTGYSSIPPSFLDDEADDLIEEAVDDIKKDLNKIFGEPKKSTQSSHNIIKQTVKDIADKHNIKIRARRGFLSSTIFGDIDKFHTLYEYLPKNLRYIPQIFVLEKPNDYNELIAYLDNRKSIINFNDQFMNQPSIGIDIVAWRAEIKNYRDEYRGVFFASEFDAKQYLSSSKESQLKLGGLYSEGGNLLKRERILIRKPFLAPDKTALLGWLASKGNKDAARLLKTNDFGIIEMKNIWGASKEDISPLVPPYPLKDKVIAKAMRELGYDAVLYTDYPEIQVVDYQKIIIRPEDITKKRIPLSILEELADNDAARAAWLENEFESLSIEKNPVRTFFSYFKDPTARREITSFADYDLVYGLYQDGMAKRNVDKYGGHLVQKYFDEFIESALKRGELRGTEWLELSIKKLDDALFNKDTIIHFFLDGMGGADEIKRILSLKGKYIDKITSIELRHIIRNWNQFKGKVRFYINEQEIVIKDWSPPVIERQLIRPQFIPLKDLYDELDISQRLKVFETKEKLLQRLEAGFDKMIVIDAGEFAKILEAQGNPISSIDENNIKYLMEVERLDGFDSYPKIYLDKNGLIDILEGNHRIEIARRQNKKIQLIVKRAELDEILNKVTKLLGQRKVQVLYSDTPTTWHRLDKDIKRPISPEPIRQNTPLASAVDIADETWTQKFKSKEVVDEFKKLMSKYLSLDELRLSADDLQGLTKLKEIAEPLIAEIRDIYGPYQNYKVDILSLIQNKTPFSMDILQDISYRFLKREYINYINLIFRHQEIKPALALLRAMKDGYKFDGPIKSVLHIMQDSTRQHFTETIKSQFTYYIKEKLNWPVPEDFLENLFRETIKIDKNSIQFPSLEEFKELYNTGKIIREKKIPLPTIEKVVEEIRPSVPEKAPEIFEQPSPKILAEAPNPIEQSAEETAKFVRETFIDGKVGQGATIANKAFDYLATFKGVIKNIIGFSPMIAAMLIKDPIKFNQDQLLAQLTDEEIVFFFDILSIYERQKTVLLKNSLPLINDAIIQKIYDDYKTTFIESEDINSLFDEFRRPTINSQPYKLLAVVSELSKKYDLLVDSASTELLEQQKSANKRASKKYSRAEKEKVLLDNAFEIEKTSGREVWEILAAQKKIKWLEAEMRDIARKISDNLKNGIQKSVFEVPNKHYDRLMPKLSLFKNKPDEHTKEYITEYIHSFIANSIKNIKDYPITIPWELKEFTKEQLTNFYENLIAAIGSAIITGAMSGGAWLFLDIAMSAFVLIQLGSSIDKIPKSAIISPKPNVGNKNKYIDFIARVNNGETPSDAFKNSGLINEIPSGALPKVPGFDNRYKSLANLVEQYRQSYEKIDSIFKANDLPSNEKLYQQFIEEVAKLKIFDDKTIEFFKTDKSLPIEPNLPMGQDTAITLILSEALKDIQTNKFKLIDAFRNKLEEIQDGKIKLITNGTSVKPYQDELQTYYDATRQTIQEIELITQLLSQFIFMSDEQKLTIFRRLSDASLNGFHNNEKFKKYLNFLSPKQRESLGLFLDTEDPDIFIPSPSAPSKIVVKEETTDATNLLDKAKDIYKKYQTPTFEWLTDLDDAIENFKKERELKPALVTRQVISDTMYIVPSNGLLEDTFQRNISVKQQHGVSPIVPIDGPPEADGIGAGVANNNAPQSNQSLPDWWINHKDAYEKQWGNFEYFQKMLGGYSDKKLRELKYDDYVDWRNTKNGAKVLNDAIQGQHQKQEELSDKDKLLNWYDDTWAGYYKQTQSSEEIRQKIFTKEYKTSKDIENAVIKDIINDLKNNQESFEDSNYIESNYYLERPDGTRDEITGNKAKEYIEKIFQERQKDTVSRQDYNIAKIAHKKVKQVEKQYNKKLKEKQKQDEKKKEKEKQKEARTKVKETKTVVRHTTYGKILVQKETTYTKANLERKKEIEKKKKNAQYKQSYQTGRTRWEKYVNDEKKKGNLIKDDNKTRVEYGMKKTNGHSAGCKCSACKSLMKEEDMLRKWAEAMDAQEAALKAAAAAAAAKLKEEAEKAAAEAKRRLEEAEKEREKLAEERRKRALQHKDGAIPQGYFVFQKQPSPLPIHDGGVGLGKPSKMDYLGEEEIKVHKDSPKISDGGIGLGLPANIPAVDEPPQEAGTPKQYFGPTANSDTSPQPIVGKDFADLPISDGGHGMGRPTNPSDEHYADEETAGNYKTPLPIHDGGGGFGQPNFATEDDRNSPMVDNRLPWIPATPWDEEQPVPIGGNPPTNKPSSQPPPKPPPPPPPQPNNKGQLGLYATGDKEDYSNIARNAARDGLKKAITPTQKATVINNSVKTIRPGGRY